MGDTNMLQIRLQKLEEEYRETKAELRHEDTSDEHAFWLEQELIGIGMEIEELEGGRNEGSN